MSFMTLGIFWNGQQAQLNSFSRSDRHLSWIHIAFLFAVSIMPFTTRLLAEFITYRSVLIAYWANILLLGLVLFVSWRYATRAGLLREEITHESQCAVERRIVVAQALYAFGALLVRDKHLPQHRLHHSGPAQLRPGAAAALSVRNIGS